LEGLTVEALRDAKLRWSLRFTLGLLFCPVAILFLIRYAQNLSAILSFPYDWEPTDGDHLNFAHRLAQGLPIYLSMQGGEVLDIYNPLYHAIVALLGGQNAGLSFARSVAAIFWLLIPVSLFVYVRRQLDIFHGIIAAVIVTLTPMRGLLTDCVQVSPNSTMACFFLWSIICAERCVANSKSRWWNWLLAGMLPAACFMAKQQGIIAAGTIGVYFLARRVPFKKLMQVSLGFALFAGSFIIYLEIQNSGQYLTTAILNVSKIIVNDKAFAWERMIRFFCKDALALSCCVVLSLLRTRGRLSQLSIWNVSMLLHVPFLLSILGNNGGGDNYFLTTWITMVVGSLALTRDLEKKADFSDMLYFLLALAALHLAAVGNLPLDWVPPEKPGRVFWPSAFSHKLLFWWTVLSIAGWWSIGWICRRKANGAVAPDRVWYRSEMILALVCLSASVSALRLHFDLCHMIEPTQELRDLMAEYYAAVNELARKTQDPKGLAIRNAGALVTQGVRVDSEAFTLFTAWRFPQRFRRDTILDRIRERKYHLITTRPGQYPPSVRSAIEANYDVAFEKPINVVFGQVGRAVVYVPKTD